MAVEVPGSVDCDEGAGVVDLVGGQFRQGCTAADADAVSLELAGGGGGIQIEFARGDMDAVALALKELFPLRVKVVPLPSLVRVVEEPPLRLAVLAVEPDWRSMALET